MAGHRLHCPLCGALLQDQVWARRTWVDCPSMHRLAVEPAAWEAMCREQLLVEIREFMSGMPPIPGGPE